MLLFPKFFGLFLLFLFLSMPQAAHAETKVQINGRTITNTSDNQITESPEKSIILEISPTPIEIQLPPKKIEIAIPTIAPVIEKVESERVRRHLKRRLTPMPTKIQIQPTFSPTRTMQPTKFPTPKQSSITPTPTKSISPISLDEKITYIMQGINNYRKEYNLPGVKTDKYTCDLAKIRAKEIAVSFNHDGFRERIAANALPYPTYKLVTENLARTADYKRVVPLWINSSGHAANMRKDTPYICVQSYGNYYAFEGWRP